MSFKKKRYLVRFATILSILLIISFSFLQGQYCHGKCPDGDYWYISIFVAFSVYLLGFCLMFYFFTGVSWYVYSSGDKFMTKNIEKSGLSFFLLKDYRPGARDD
ncbi:hypothetical protein TH25_10550 [Thalassospira profundimaris]|uniref:Uncharacterized protein n=1 Tax=Thalassospira profundimaris TaxID=502049 RepID=A0A367XAM3_9PROT|nr:hypothetical protein TH25_10550 [Thalassospira profundimaris]